MSGLIARWVDERFLDHRRRSTAYAGMGGGALAIGLFAYRYFVQHVWSWDLFAVAIAIVTIKVAFMIWYLATD